MAARPTPEAIPMLKFTNKDDLQRLLDDEVQESLNLDYKASGALAKDSKARDELCKDVSAFANSAGGQIVYGIEERDRKPVRIDEGTELTREWIEQVVDSNVQPRLEQFIVTPISLGSGRYAYVLTIGQALGRAPHQAPDKKYYKRQNFQSVPMEDYEIRDTLRRATTPELKVELAFGTGPTATVEFPHNDELSKPIAIIVKVINLSPQPAYHVLVQIGVDAELPLRTVGDFYQIGAKNDQYWLGHRRSSPPGLPIFKEIDPTMGHSHDLSFTIAYPSQRMGTEVIFYLAASVQTPGYAATERWVIHQRGGILRMCPPGHRLNPR
jgi:Putative DNA-binding domain